MFSSDFSIRPGNTPGTVQVDADTAEGRRAMSRVFGLRAIVGTEVPRENYARLMDSLRKEVAS